MADILLVVTDTTGMFTNETAVETALTGAGHAVTTINDETAAPGNVGDYGCIVISPDVASASLGTKYRDTAVPAVVLDATCWRSSFDMGTGTVGLGNGTDIEVQAENGTDGDGAAHPIAVAAGLSLGANTLYSVAGGIDREDGLAAAALAVGWHFVSGRKVLFTYETSDTMANATVAPARRVGYGFAAAASWNALGETVFLESVNWAANVSATTTVSIDGADPQSVAVGSTLQLSATVTNPSGSTTWASSNGAVATVDATGLVTGVATGSVTITATNNAVSDTVTVNVTAASSFKPQLVGSGNLIGTGPLIQA